MKKKIRKFLFYFAAFSIGLFFGEWLLDIIINSSRSAVKIEIFESIIIAFIVAILFAFFSNFKKD